MGAGRALLYPAHVKRPRGELDLVPAQVHQLRRPQAVPVRHQHHRSVPVPPAVSRGGFHQPLDLGLGQVLAGPQLAVGWRLGVTVRFTVAGETSLRCVWPCVRTAALWMTVRIMPLLRTVCGRGLSRNRCGGLTHP